MAGLNNKLVLDTNVILYAVVNNYIVAKTLIEDNDIYISELTEIELMGYHRLSKEESQVIKALLECMTIVPLNSEIKILAIEFRRKYNLKLPDAIIAATAHEQGCFLVSADKKLQGIKDIKVIVFNAP